MTSTSTSSDSLGIGAPGKGMELSSSSSVPVIGTSSNADNRYYYDPNELQKLKVAKPWMKDSKYFTTVAISPSAVIKIMNHCYSGVEKGIAKGGNPIEVMGMLLGRPDPITPTTLVVSDAFPLPIEGFETRVVADDDNVVNHMISLGESLERTRYEKFMGWYHSHPFDYIPERSHCFLSQTDLSTQLQWQRAEDPHGNPFVAIVVDPIRSTIQHNPELKAFRAYPPEYNPSTQYECPNGTIEPIEQKRLEEWGSCWNRYYELKVEYYMSQVSRKVLETMTQDYLWIRTFENTPPSKLTSQLIASKAQFSHASTIAKTSKSSATTSVTQQQQRQHSGGLVAESSSSSTTNKDTTTSISGTTGGVANISNKSIDQQSEWKNAIEQLSNVNTEQMAQIAIQDAKNCIFS